MRYAIAYIDYTIESELYLQVVDGKNWQDALLKVDSIGTEILDIIKEFGTKKQDLSELTRELYSNDFLLAIKEI